jgi:hypothetical protein
MFTGWSLTDLRKLTPRERTYWRGVVKQKLGLEERETERGT